MKKYFLFLVFIGICYYGYSQNVALTLKTLNGDRIQYVDANITRLEYSKEHIIKIEGLSQLKSLKIIYLDMMTRMEDFSFLRDASGLTKIVMRGRDYTNTDFSFIKNLPDLKILIIGGASEKRIRFDLINNKKLEFLAFEFGVLECFPELENIPETLQYLSLYRNKIQCLPGNFSEYANIKIFLGENCYNTKAFDNIIFDWPGYVLNEEYLP